MAEPDAKRPKPDDEAPYELIYWPVVPGLGELVRLLFEESGEPYVDTAKDSPSTDAAFRRILDLVAPSNLGDASNPPVFAPPALRHGDLLLHQSPNIMLYLAPRLGLAPPAGSPALFHLNQIVLTVLDGLQKESHNTHHPICTSLYYEDQKAEAKKSAKSFIGERLPKFMGYLQRVLDAETSGDGPWLYGDSLTYADLVVFQCIHGNEFAFPKAMASLKASGKYDGVFKLYDAVAERPNIKAYMASDRRAEYSQGVWRHYPELEED